MVEQVNFHLEASAWAHSPLEVGALMVDLLEDFQLAVQVEAHEEGVEEEVELEVAEAKDEVGHLEQLNHLLQEQVDLLLLAALV